MRDASIRYLNACETKLYDQKHKKVIFYLVFCKKEVVQKLKEKGHSICIIIARNEEDLPPDTYGTSQLMVKEWLQDNDIIYDELVFSKGSKLPYSMERKLDIMIENSPRNIVEIAKEIPVLCFDNPYNK